VKNGLIYNFGMGISSSNSYDGNFTNLSIRNVGGVDSGGSARAIYVSGGARNRIAQNNFSNSNYLDSLGALNVVEISGSSDNIIENNLFRNNTHVSQQSLNIVVVSSSNNNTIRDNIIDGAGNSYIGVQVGSSSLNNLFVNNTLINLRDDAFEVASFVNLSLISNNITNNSQGVHMVSGNSLILESNIIRNNSQGIILDSSAGNSTLINNTFVGNSLYSIVDRSGNVNINKLVYNNSDGEDGLMKLIMVSWKIWHF